MNVRELPHSTFVAASSDEDELAAALEKIFGRHKDEFYYMLPVTGATRSERLLSRERVRDGVCINDGYPSSMDVNAHILASELLRLSEPDSVPPARYDLPEGQPGQERGWEILVTEISGQPVALARAVWI